jgi:deoxyadenosine/deoxycytidine kinase
MIIAFEGLPGVGKTTTANLVARALAVPAVTESTQRHPFLDTVYRDDARHDLEVELAFLLLHASAWRRLDRSGTVVTDFTPAKDLLFARDMLSGQDLDLFEAAHSRLNAGAGPPDLVIYLRATPEFALERVRGRYERDEQRLFEQSMELGRLRRIERQYETHRKVLGTRVLPLELAEVIEPGEPEQASKDRVARAAGDLIGGRAGSELPDAGSS